MKQLLVMPFVSYLTIILFFIAYVLIEWHKQDTKKNTTFAVLFIVLLINANNVMPSLESHYLLSAFNADSIVIKSDTTEITVATDDLFAGEYGIFSENDGIEQTLRNFIEKPLFELRFYKKGKRVLKLKVFQVENKTEYTHEVNGKLVVIKFNGNTIKYNDIFYKNIGKYVD